MNSSQGRRRLQVTVGGESLVSCAGGALLVETARATGLDRAVSGALAPWSLLGARHDPGKILINLAVTLALGGDCLSDVAVVRARPALFGSVASDPTVSRLVGRLAADADAVLGGLRSARAFSRALGWAHRCPVPAAGLVPLDLDGSLVAAHSEKERAAPTFKRGFGFHPLLAFIDHTAEGRGGGGEPLAAVLRTGASDRLCKRGSPDDRLSA